MWLVLLLALASAEVEFVVRSVRAVTAAKFPVGYRFNSTTTGEEVEVKEISGCRFRWQDDVAVLIGDEGELYEARIRVNETLVNGTVNETELEVEFLSAVALEKPAGFDYVDAESLAFWGDRLYVSAEYHENSAGKSQLAVLEYDRETGEVISKRTVPAVFTERTTSNKGFEAMMATPDGLVVTTEGPLDGDPESSRRLIGWDGDDDFKVSFRASYVADLRNETHDDPDDAAAAPQGSSSSFSVVDFESLGRHNFLSLEQDHTDEAGNTVRLYEVRVDENASDASALFSFDDADDVANWTSVRATRKRLLLDWNQGEPLNGEYEIDNYEGLCLMPNYLETNDSYVANLLLVNDDNGDDTQIGTQFVLCEIVINKTNSIPPLFQGPPATVTQKPPRSSSSVEAKNDGTAWLWLLPVLLFIMLAAAVCTCRAKPDPTVETGDEGDNNGIELAYDVGTKKGSKGRGGKAKYSRVGNGLMANDIEENEDDDEIDYV
mmetsp:Transcript_1165/g.3955  ORF Transcript_1165/g.3955 Transcript_1165/m.3955 type:complete len:492 (-) Transcript_1165:517-1992(-)